MGEKQTGISIIYVGMHWERAPKTTGSMTRFSKESGTKLERTLTQNLFARKKTAIVVS